MIQEVNYTNINRVLDDLHDEALMEDLTLEQAVRHTVSFIGKMGFPKLYQDKMAEVDIQDFRGVLPCDLVSIVQVKDNRTGICLRSMTDNFPMGGGKSLANAKGTVAVGAVVNKRGEVEGTRELYIPRGGVYLKEPSFKTQGRVIYTSFPDGNVTVAYKAIPVDCDGFPMLIDNEVYLAALEAYITVKVLRNKFRLGKISTAVYQEAQQEYAWCAAQLNSEMMIPSVSEMESIARMWNTMIDKPREFDNGFIGLGDREYLRKKH